MDWAINDWIDGIGGRLVAGSAETRISGVSTDTRSIEPGQLFVALQGPNFDAHNFLAQAVEKGAPALMISNIEAAKGLDSRVAAVAVENTLDGLGDLATAWRNKFEEVRIAALSGSSGKTTTKEMLRHIVEPIGGLATAGNLNNRIGAPQTVFRLRPEHKLAVFELGMNEPGELTPLAKMIRPEVVALTNVGRAHIGNFESSEALRRAKAELIVNAPEAAVVLNADDFGSMWIAREFGDGRDLALFAIKERAHFLAENIEVVSPLGYRFEIVTPQERLPVTMRMFGRHNIVNALCATAVAWLLDVEIEDIVRGLEAFRAAPMRSEIIELGKITIIADCYNANPDSVEAALEALDDYGKSRRRIFVFADMLELGDDAQMAHRLVGQAVADHSIQLFATTGELAKWAAWESSRMGVRVGHFETKDQLCKALEDELRPGDLVLVKGSRMMQLEDVINRLKETL